jgi:homoserine O-acetyltransferase/O-succinyltransferase
VLTFMGSNPIQRQKESPTLQEADKNLDAAVSSMAKSMDANNVLYALESSQDYDPAPGLEKIQAPLLAVNSADDLINPPELGVLEREIKRVKHGKAIIIPLSDRQGCIKLIRLKRALGEKRFLASIFHREIGRVIRRIAFQRLK